MTQGRSPDTSLPMWTASGVAGAPGERLELGLDIDQHLPLVLIVFP